MKFDAPSLLTSMAVSSVGFVAFSYGKKMKRLPQMLAGVLLMVFPYFAPDVGWTLGGAIAIVGLLWVGLRSGL